MPQCHDLYESTDHRSAEPIAPTGAQCHDVSDSAPKDSEDRLEQPSDSASTSR
jgi:hypothetical protein